MKFIYILFIFSFFCCNNKENITIDNEYSEKINHYSYGNNEEKIIIDKEEYYKQSDDYNRLNVSHIELQNNYNVLQGEYNNLINNYDQRKLISLQVIEEGRDEILMDYYGNGLYIFGITEIEGYYIRVKYTIDHYVNDTFINAEEVEYDGFLITAAPAVYLNSVRNLISENNKAYILNSNNDIIADIKINHFNNNYRNLITKSDKNNKIKLRVFIKHPYPTSGRVPAFIEILGIVD